MSAPTSPHPELERYLRDLRLGLSALPADERDDLVAEVRSHLVDRAARGGDPLAGFAPADAYAAEFLAERALAGAIARGSSWALGSALLTGARTARVALAVVPLAILHLAAVALVGLAALKPLFPGHVGAFVGEGGLLVVGAWSGGAGPGVREVLGWWAIPVFAAGGALLLWGADRALRAVARGRLSRVRSRARGGAPAGPG